MAAGSSPRSVELRPLRAIELLDAAIEIARRDLGLYGGLAVLGMGPLAALVIRLVVARSGGQLNARAHAGYALALTLALLWRYVVMGATAVALEHHLEGDRPRLGPCLQAAVRRGVSLAVAGAVVFLLNAVLYVLLFANVWLGWLALCAIPLCVERGATGLRALGGSRRILAGLGGKAAAVNALHVLLGGLALLNLVLGTQVLLALAHSLFDVDVAWLQRFLSPAQPTFLVLAAVAAMTLLEPIRHLTCALLLWDARIRRDAHDIGAVFAKLGRDLPARARPPGPSRTAGAARGGVAAVVLVLLASLPARATETDPGALDRRLLELDRRLQDLAYPDDEVVERDADATSRAVAGLPPVERAKLGRFLDEGEQGLARLQAQGPGAAQEREASQLAARIEEVIEAVPLLGAPPAAPDPRALAREVLAQPEFRRRPAAPVEGGTRSGETWFDRLLRRLFGRSHGDVRVRGEVPAGLGGAFFRVLTIVLLCAGATLILIQVSRWLMSRRASDERAPPAAPAAGSAEAPLPDPTARSSTEWLADADAAAARGDFRAAVRALYLALLSALCRRGVLRYDPARTNGEYVRSFRGPGAERAVFRSVTLLSDAVLYGALAVSDTEFRRARELAVRLAAEGWAP